MSVVRLQKLLSIAGVASRRAAERLIVEGRVSVNGEVVRTLGTQADPGKDRIGVDGCQLRFDRQRRYLVLNKPTGYVTTRRDPEGRRTVLDLLRGVREYVYPVGRLDFDTEGLLLLTSDGDLAARLTHPRHGVEKVYLATVLGVPDEHALEALRTGIRLGGKLTASAGVTRGAVGRTGRHPTTELTITLREGRNRQVRRMCTAIGHPVRSLVRVGLGPIRLGDLPPGRWRDLTDAEVRRLMNAVSLPAAPQPAGPDAAHRTRRAGRTGRS
ncbi:MAG: pseudouridine synthase [Acidobacteriota bacterium]